MFHNHNVSQGQVLDKGVDVGPLWDSDESRRLALPPLRGIAAFCRYSRAGNLDVRGTLIFERPSYVEGSRCMGFRVVLTLFLVQNQA